MDRGDHSLPPGWEKKWNQQYRRFYYVDHNTKQTQWTPPVVTKLPDRWEKKWSAQYNRYYYVNHTTKSTQWNVPDNFQDNEEDSDASDSSIEESRVVYYSAQELKSYCRNMFNLDIKQKLKTSQGFDSFFEETKRSYPKIGEIMSKCGTSQFDKDEMLPLVDSLMYAKMEALNRRYEEDASKVQLEGLTEVYSSFTDGLRQNNKIVI